MNTTRIIHKGKTKNTSNLITISLTSRLRELPHLVEVLASKSHTPNRPFQGGLGRCTTFLEDNGYTATGNPLLAANIEMQL